MSAVTSCEANIQRELPAKWEGPRLSSNGNRVGVASRASGVFRTAAYLTPPAHSAPLKVSMHSRALALVAWSHTQFRMSHDKVLVWEDQS